jgi:hypothetical protein
VSRLETWLDRLPAGLLSGGGREALERILGGAARVDDLLTRRAEALGDLLDPELVPDDLVPLLAAEAGLGPVLSVRLPVDSWRRLIAAAPRLWMTRGQREAWILAVRAIVGGREAILLDWFSRRVVVDGTAWGALVLEPDPTAADAGPYGRPSTVSDLWVEDPDEEADLAGAGAVLELVRVAGQRVNLRRALWVDDGRRGATRYLVTAGTVTTSGASWTLADEGSALTSGKDWSDVGLTLRASISESASPSSSGFGVLLQFASASAFAFLSILADGQVTLARVVAGTPTGIGSANVSPQPGAVYEVRIRVIRRVDGDLEWSIWWEDLEIIAETESDPGPVEGDLGLTTSGDVALEVQSVIAWRSTDYEIVRVGPPITETAP